MRIIINTLYVPPPPPFLPGFQLFTRDPHLATPLHQSMPARANAGFRSWRLPVTSSTMQYPLPYHHRTLKIGKMVLMCWCLGFLTNLHDVYYCIVASLACIGFVQSQSHSRSSNIYCMVGATGVTSVVVVTCQDLYGVLSLRWATKELDGLVYPGVLGSMWLVHKELFRPLTGHFLL